MRKFYTHSVSASLLFNNFSHHVFVRPGFIQYDRTNLFRLLFSNNLLLLILDANDAKIWLLREIFGLRCKSIWRPWRWKSDPNINNKFSNSWCKTSDMKTHSRHENWVFFSNFFFWKSCSKQKLGIFRQFFIFINNHCLKVSSWANLKFLTRRLLLMISKSHISFKAITFSVVYITKFKLFKTQNENGKNHYGNF